MIDIADADADACQRRPLQIRRLIIGHDELVA